MPEDGIDILEGIACGCSLREVGDDLGIGMWAVKGTMRSVFRARMVERGILRPCSRWASSCPRRGPYRRCGWRRDAGRRRKSTSPGRQVLSITRPIRSATGSPREAPAAAPKNRPLPRGGGRFFEQPAVDVERRPFFVEHRPSRSGKRPSPSCGRHSSRDGLPSSREELRFSEAFLRFSPATCGFLEASCLFRRQPANRSRHPAFCSRRPAFFDGDGRLRRATRRVLEIDGRFSLENGGCLSNDGSSREETPSSSSKRAVLPGKCRSPRGKGRPSREERHCPR